MFDRIDKGLWWDVGLNLVEGCSPVSEGCKNCWSLTAANMRRFNPNPKTADRYEDTVWKDPHCRPQWTGQVNPQWQDLDKIGRSRTPQVYTFWNDLFHPGVEEEFVTSVMLRILTHPQHFDIICTKRPERALEYFRLCYDDFNNNAPDKIDWRRLMIMTTAENQEMADLRLPILLQIPGVLHGVSVEPGLGRVDFCQPFAKYLRELDWVICGGETGPHARPMHPDWLREVRDQCKAAGVPFFFKSWGEWVPKLSMSLEQWAYINSIRKKVSWGVLDAAGNYFPETSPWNGNQGSDSAEREYVMYRVGKKAAGRLLDGRTWNEVPVL